MTPFLPQIATVASGEASWEAEQPVPQGVSPEGRTSGPGGHRGLGRKAALRQAGKGGPTGFTNQGANILLAPGITCCLGNAAVTKVTASCGGCRQAWVHSPRPEARWGTVPPLCRPPPPRLVLGGGFQLGDAAGAEEMI